MDFHFVNFPNFSLFSAKIVLIFEINIYHTNYDRSSNNCFANKTSMLYISFHIILMFDTFDSFLQIEKENRIERTEWNKFENCNLSANPKENNKNRKKFV